MAAVSYRTIVIDPPWPVKDSGPRTAASKGFWEQGKGTAGKRSVVPYQRMTLAEIAGLPVPDLAERDCHLYVWAVNQFLTDAYEIVRNWGFKPSTLLTWCKPPMGLGLGGAYVNATEFAIFARRGTLPALTRVDRTWFQWPRPYLHGGGPTHSAKPEAFLDMVEQVSPDPRLEMFARRDRLGWDTWGNECMNNSACVGGCGMIVSTAREAQKNRRRQHLDSRTPRNPAHSPRSNLSGPSLARSRTVGCGGAQRGPGPAKHGPWGPSGPFSAAAPDYRWAAAAGAFDSNRAPALSPVSACTGRGG